MAFLESGIFCSYEEYKQGFDRHVDGSELQEDSFYTIAMLLDSEKWDASKQAARVIQAAKGAGFYAVKHVFVDKDLNDMENTTCIVKVEQGTIRRMPKVKIKDLRTDELFSIREAYYLDYFDEQFGGLLRQGQSLEVRK